MSHLHNYEELVERTKTMIEANQITMKGMATATQVAVLSRSILDFLLEELGVKVERPIEPS